MMFWKKLRALKKNRDAQKGDLNVMKEQTTLPFEGRAKWLGEKGKYKGPVARTALRRERSSV